jgi:hypothetical protein
MKNKLIIRPTQASNVTLELKFEYYDSKLNKNIFIPIDKSKVYTDKQFAGNKTPLKVKFEGPTSNYSFEWESDNDKDQEIADAMMRHPLIRCKDNDNMKNPLFELIDTTKKVSNDAMIIKKKGLVFNLVNNTTVGIMRDVAFAFGYNPVGKEYGEIFTSLLDFSTGILMSGQDANGVSNLDRAIDLLDDNMDQTYIIMKKAIALGIIAHRDGIYYVKTDIAGDTEDKLLLYLKENKGMYEQFVKKEVALRDVLPAEDIDKAVKTTVAGLTHEVPSTYRRKSIGEEVKYKNLQEEAKALGIKGVHLFSEKNLAIEIYNVKKKKQKEDEDANHKGAELEAERSEK